MRSAATSDRLRYIAYPIAFRYIFCDKVGLAEAPDEEIAVCSRDIVFCGGEG